MSGLDASLQPAPPVLHDCFKAAARNLTDAFGRSATTAAVSMFVAPPEEVAGQLAFPLVAAAITLDGATSGDALVGVSEEDARVMADLMMGGDGTQPAEEFGELQLSAVAEAFGQTADSIGTCLTRHFERDVSVLCHEAGQGLLSEQLDDLREMAAGDVLHLFVAEMNIEGLRPIRLYQIISASVFKEIAGGTAPVAVPEIQAAVSTPDGAALGIPQDEPAAIPRETRVAEPVEAVASVAAAQEPAQAPSGEAGVLTENEIAELLGGARAQAGLADASAAQVARFEELTTPAPTPVEARMDLVLDIPVPITVELGRATMRIKDILELGSGAIVELDKASGEPVDILAGGRPIAKGEVVVVDENFGVRILQILRPIGGGGAGEGTA